MNEKLLRSVIRSNMRTANRRLSDYVTHNTINIYVKDKLEIFEKQGKSFLNNGRLVMPRGLSLEDLEALYQLQKDLQKSPTYNQWNKIAKDIDSTPDKLSRSLINFKAQYGDKYNDWINDVVVDKHKIESKGNTLASMLKEIVNDYDKKEYSDREEYDIFNTDGWQSF